MVKIVVKKENTELMEMILKISQDPKTTEEAERFQRRISTLSPDELLREYTI